MTVVFSYLLFCFFLSSGSEWVNPEDPNVIAENELLGAAASIEAAARKLAELKPRMRPKVGLLIFKCTSELFHILPSWSYINQETDFLN